MSTPALRPRTRLADNQVAKQRKPMQTGGVPDLQRRRPLWQKPKPRFSPRKSEARNDEGGEGDPRQCLQRGDRRPRTPTSPASTEIREHWACICVLKGHHSNRLKNGSSHLRRGRTQAPLVNKIWMREY